MEEMIRTGPIEAKTNSTREFVLHERMLAELLSDSAYKQHVSHQECSGRCPEAGNVL